MKLIFVAAGSFIVCCTSATAQRIVPTSDVWMYVSPYGNNETGSGSQNAPFATPQRAADELYAKYDFQCKYKPGIQLASAPQGQQYYYPGLQISGRLVGQCGTMRPLVVGDGRPTYPIGKYLPLTLRGDPAYPLGAFLNPNPNAGRPAVPALSLTEGAALKVEGISFDTTLAKQDNVDVFNGAFLDLSHVVFGNAGDPAESWNIHIGVAWSSQLVITGPIDINGGAMGFLQTGQGAVVYCDNNVGANGTEQIPITFHDNPLFRMANIMADANSTIYLSCRVQGTARGHRAVLTRNAVLDTLTGKTLPDATIGPCNQDVIPGDKPMVIQDHSVCR
jgi:hypothetical protein